MSSVNQKSEAAEKSCPYGILIVIHVKGYIDSISTSIHCLENDDNPEFLDMYYALLEVEKHLNGNLNVAQSVSKIKDEELKRDLTYICDVITGQESKISPVPQKYKNLKALPEVSSVEESRYMFVDKVPYSTSGLSRFFVLEECDH